MKVIVALAVFAIILMFTACSKPNPTSAKPELDAWERIDLGAFIVDVRTPEEYATGHIDGALNIPLDQVESRISEFGPVKDQAIVLYCKSGRRSGLAREILTKGGYTNVLNAGGYTELLAGKPK